MLSQKLTPLSFLVPNTLGRGVWRSLYFLLFFNLFHFGLFMKKATPLAPPSGKSARLGPCGPCGSLWSMRSMRFFFPCARMICRSVFARWYFPRAGSPTRPAPYRSKVRSFGVRWGWGVGFATKGGANREIEGVVGHRVWVFVCQCVFPGVSCGLGWDSKGFFWSLESGLPRTPRLISQ